MSSHSYPPLCNYYDCPSQGHVGLDLRVQEKEAIVWEHTMGIGHLDGLDFASVPLTRSEGNLLPGRASAIEAFRQKPPPLNASTPTNLPIGSYHTASLRSLFWAQRPVALKS